MAVTFRMKAVQIRHLGHGDVCYYVANSKLAEARPDAHGPFTVIESKGEKYIKDTWNVPYRVGPSLAEAVTFFVLDPASPFEHEETAMAKTKAKGSKSRQLMADLKSEVDSIRAWIQDMAPGVPGSDYYRGKSDGLSAVVSNLEKRFDALRQGDGAHK